MDRKAEILKLISDLQVELKILQMVENSNGGGATYQVTLDIPYGMKVVGVTVA